MNEFLTTLLKAVLVAVVPVCAVFTRKGLKAAATYLGQKSESDIARKYLNAVADAVAIAVTYTSQTYVDALKKSGEFTKENQKKALWHALDKAKDLLTVEAKVFLESAYGDLNGYLKSRIETEVRNQKQSVNVLSIML